MFTQQTFELTSRKDGIKYYLDRFCLCGCKEGIQVKPYHKYDGVPRFINGHNARIKRKFKKVLKSKFCGCGCGQMTKPGNRFVNGHNSRGRKTSEETKEKLRKSSVGKKFSKRTRKRMREARLGMKLSEETKMKIGIAGRGRHSTEETRKKISKALKGRMVSKETREKLRKAQTGKKYSDKSKEKMRQTHLDLWRDAKYRERCVKATFEATKFKPTKPEKILDKILRKLFLDEYKYVGNGSFLVGYRSPDFVNVNGQKKIIELFGDFWHNEMHTGVPTEEHERERINHFAEYGYKTLIIWEHELEDLQKLEKRLLCFHNR